MVLPNNLEWYGQIVGIVIAGATVVNQKLISDGNTMGVHVYYKESLCKEWFEREQSTKKQKIGVGESEYPVQPWVWKMKK